MRHDRKSPVGGSGGRRVHGTVRAQLSRFPGAALRRGMVIPAHPLALTAARKLDERRQRALTRYYLDAGAGGIAVGVRTSRFAFRRPAVGLYRPVLVLAAGAAGEREGGSGKRS